MRSLVKFLADSTRLPAIVTDLSDPVLARKEGELLDPGEDYADYKLKVNRYLNEHRDDPIIRKLHTNVPITEDEIERLGEIFTNELGTERDYQSTYGDRPFGLLVRSIVKLDHDAVMAAFAEFINDGALTQQQIAFVRKVIDFVEDNGYMEPADLMKPPFDRPATFIRLFDDGRQKRLVQIILQVKNNALALAA